MKIHFISIGGSAMHNLAIALYAKGFQVTGSDDEIFDPAKTRLDQYGLLPEEMGWFPEKIHKELDAVILGMHARSDNMELLKAKELGIKMYSYPEFLYEQSKNKKRIVIGGSHGKTTITAMILHVLKYAGVDADYMVGAQLTGFDVMVKITDDTPYMIIEGDEYLTSPIDLRPKFHLYKPNIALISGIAWDHVNVFPTFEEYVNQFAIFTEVIEPHGVFIYCNTDEHVREIATRVRKDIQCIPYSIPLYTMKSGTTFIQAIGKEIPLQVFGRHNLINIEGAKMCCLQMGITESMFYEAIQSFSGASRRLEIVRSNSETTIFKDFAHSPSKLQATIQAVKEQYPDKKLVACLELHTFSSLNKSFLTQYNQTMNLADVAMVYFNPHTLSHKKLPLIDVKEIMQAFGKNDIHVFTNSIELNRILQQMDWKQTDLLMMSSGNFDGLDMVLLAEKIIS